MEEHDLSDAQVIYIEEDAIVVDGKQYVLSREIDKTSNMVLQEDTFTHPYLLDTKNVNMIDKNNIIIGGNEYLKPNVISEECTDEVNQILQYSSEQDVITQVILSEEQCRIFQEFGRVVFQQGSRKFLLDNEGLKEIDSSTVTENMECLLSEDANKQTSNYNIPSTSKPLDDDGNIEEGVEEYSVAEDNKDSVFQYLQGRCDVMLDGSQHINIEPADSMELAKHSGIYFENIESLAVMGTAENENNVSDKKCVKTTITDFSTSNIGDKINKNHDRIKHTNTKQSNITSDKLNSAPGPQIKDGKIVMMPEDAYTLQTRKLIKSHLTKNKNCSSGDSGKVTNVQRFKSLKSNKLPLKVLKDHKIFIGNTEKGKSVYGKIIDILNPPVTTKTVHVNSRNIKKTISNKDGTQPTQRDEESKYSKLGDDAQNTHKSLVTFKTKPNILATNLNKIISEKESKEKSDDNIILALSETKVVDSDYGKTDVKSVKLVKQSTITLTEDLSLVNTTNLSVEDLQEINQFFSQAPELLKTVSGLKSKDILIIYEKMDGTTEMFTGKLFNIDEKVQFYHVPELWLGHSSFDKSSSLKNCYFTILKLKRNKDMRLADIVILNDGTSEMQYKSSECSEILHTNLNIKNNSFNHYLLDAENVAVKDNSNSKKKKKQEKANVMPIEEENSTVEQDVITQVILSEEQCRIFQEFGRVIFQQGSRKFLLDNEGLKEIDSNTDLKTVECFLSEDINKETSSYNVTSTSKLLDDDGNIEEGVGEYSVAEDNKDSVFQFLQGRCDVMLDGSRHINIEPADSMELAKHSGIFFVENLPVLNDIDRKDERTTECKSFRTEGEVNKNQVKIKQERLEQKSASDAGKSNPGPQIKDGKIVMMPEDAYTLNAKRVIKSHFNKNKQQEIPKKLSKSNKERLNLANPNKLSLKTLKDIKIYIGSTEDGKKIYGKIIDIVKPSGSIKKINQNSSQEISSSHTNVEFHKKINRNQLGKCKPKPEVNNVTTVNKILDNKECITEKEDIVKSSSSHTSMVEDSKNYPATLFKEDLNMTNPTESDLQKINEIFSQMPKLNKVVSCLKSRDVLIINEKECGGTDMFTGRIIEIDDKIQFYYVPELWFDGENHLDKDTLLKNGNFVVLKLVKNVMTNTTNVVIMDKAKGKQDQESTGKKKHLYCQFCKKSFYNASCLSRHMGIHNVQQEGHKCMHCSCVFRYSSTLTRHIMEKHSNLNLVHIKS